MVYTSSHLIFFLSYTFLFFFFILAEFIILGDRNNFTTHIDFTSQNLSDLRQYLKFDEKDAIFFTYPFLPFFFFLSLFFFFFLLLSSLYSSYTRTKIDCEKRRELCNALILRGRLHVDRGSAVQRVARSH